LFTTITQVEASKEKEKKIPFARVYGKGKLF
jgi:hypothetical protein